MGAMIGVIAGLAVLAAALLAVLRRTRHALAAERSARAELEARASNLEVTARQSADVLDHAPDGYFVLGADGRFLHVNDAFCRLLGFTADELLARRIEDLECSTGADSEAVAAAAMTGPRRFRATLRSRSGPPVPVEVSVVLSGWGEHTRLACLVRDESEHARAEVALRDSEAHYRNLVEASRDLIWSLDLEGRWTYVNAAAQVIYGREPHELLGTSVLDLVRPPMRDQAAQVLDELRQGKPRRQFETEHVRKDGSIVYLSVNATPRRDEHGQVIGITGTSTDISYRRRTEERLREATQRFESLVSGMPLGYVVWSRDFNVLEWNPAATAVFGYTEEEALGRSARELIVPPGAQAAFESLCQAIIAGRASQHAVLLNRRKGGGEITCEWYSTVLPDSGGGVQAVATLIRDVSERERLEAQLRQSQKLESLGVLAGGIAHDFNNLLVGILGNASLAIEHVGPDSPLRPMLERVVSAGRRATDLTQRMLAYAGRTTTDVQVMDLNGLISELAVFASAAIPKNVSLRINTGTNLPVVEADSGQMQQVIMNLLINGAEAIGDAAGEVVVSTWAEMLSDHDVATRFPEQLVRPGPYVVVEVRDNGCGMPPQVMRRMFEPFFTTKFTGRGLGLSAILGILRNHHGAISCESAVGAGTTFRVYLPAVAARVGEADGSVAAPPADSRQHGSGDRRRGGRAGGGACGAGAAGGPGALGGRRPAGHRPVSTPCGRDRRRASRHQHARDEGRDGVPGVAGDQA